MMQAQATTKHQEIIGRSVPAFSVDVTWRDLRSTGGSWDRTQPKYDFWDNFRRGREFGYEIAAQFARPLTHIKRAYVFGQKGVSLKLLEQGDNGKIKHTNAMLGRWGRTVRGQLATMLKDLLDLGNQYVIVNADGTLSIPSPETVEAEYDELDYRHLAQVTVTTRFDRLTVTDVYTADQRVITIKNITAKEVVTRYGVLAGNQSIAQRFDNLIGMIPVVHFAHDRGGNETHGRSDYESLLRIFSRYDDLGEKALDGAEIMGNPIPTWSGIEDPDQLVDKLGEATGEVDEAGDPKKQILFDPQTGIVTSGSFTLTSPPTGFTQDLLNMLKWLFLLTLENQSIPEAMLGGEMGQARATSMEQTKTFYQMIEGLRLQLEGEAGDPILGIEPRGGLHALVNIWLRYRALTDPQMLVDAVVMEWEELNQIDAKLQFEKIKYADGTGKLTDQTTLELLDLVENAEKEIEQARVEAAEHQEEFDAAMNADLEGIQPDNTDDAAAHEDEDDAAA